MIKVDSLKPFYTRVKGDKLRIVFAFEYFSIRKDDEIYKFIPTDSKEIIIDMKTGKIENESSIFAFQSGKKILRIPLYKLVLLSNMFEFLIPIIKGNMKAVQDIEERVFKFDSESLIKEIEYSVNLNGLMKMIDNALDSKDVESFNELCTKLKELEHLKP